MTVLIVCQGMASGQHCPVVGQYLLNYDPEAYDGRGFAEWTKDKSQAMEFPSMQAALRFAHQTAKSRPIRQDGKPNRPLTAFHLEFMRATDEKLEL